ncbi:NADPH:quinone oxidoreductase family protein [Aeromicrobium sp. CTD01-1L150]|uniref:NADPH:quinone oxidoreductase family protein n=1 Tax=Aeromicrobium sp. CTD01-1L150 TaxID=3341830 RepID=UPI0035C05374
MRAVQITTHDGPDALAVTDVPEPPRAHDQVLIDVRASGVSFPEVLQSRGKYQINPDLPFVPGSEVAGVVLEAPADAAVSIGDRVAGFTMLGGFAERAVAPQDMVFALPDNLSFDQGAAVPLNYLTAHFGLMVRGAMTRGETVLVHGAAGGVGTAAIQMAQAYGAGHVIAVTSTPEKAEVARAAGAGEVVGAHDFKDRVKELTNGRGVDIVVDPVGGDRFTDSLRSLAEFGRLLVIGFTGGEIPTVKVNRLLLNNVTVIGVGWGASVLDKPGYVAGEWAEILPHLASGSLTPPVGTTLPLERASDALHLIDGRAATGKVVLNP